MDITVELNEDGLASIVPENVIDSLDDPCGIGTTAVDIFQFSCDDIGIPVTVQVFAEDVHGNSTTCSAIVTVLDASGPVFDAGTLPEDQVQTADVNNEYILEDFTTDVIAIDNCSNASLVVIDQDPIVGTVLNPGVFDITLRATDDLGNISDHVFELTIEVPIGLDDNNANIRTLVLHPNPADNAVYLSNPKALNLNDLAIYDITGRLIKTIQLEGMGTQKSIDITDLAGATYLMAISNEQGKIIKLLIKE